MPAGARTVADSKYIVKTADVGDGSHAMMSLEAVLEEISELAKSLGKLRVSAAKRQLRELSSKGKA